MPSVDNPPGRRARSTRRDKPATAILTRRRAVVLGLAAAAMGLLPGRAPASDRFELGRSQFIFLRPQNPAPDIELFGIDGRRKRLRSFAGRPILLNFWASWCALCRIELPALDRLQSRHRGRLSVLAVSEDRSAQADLPRFVRSLHISHVPIFRDPNGLVAFEGSENPRSAPFALYGMPITYCIGASGLVLGYVAGAADWTAADADALVDFLGRS